MKPLGIAGPPSNKGVIRWEDCVALFVKGTFQVFVFVCVCCPQVPVDWCRRSNPCLNGGRCRQKDATFTCECMGGWSGRYCDIPGVSCEVAAAQRGELTLCHRYFVSSPSSVHTSLHLGPVFLTLSCVWVAPPQVIRRTSCATMADTASTRATPTTASARPTTRVATARARWTTVRTNPVATAPPAGAT